MAKRTELMLAGLGFSREECARIVETGCIHFYPRNSIILETPHSNELLYILVEGRVQALAVDAEGREMVLVHYKTGEHFGVIEFGDDIYTVSFREYS